ncbi:MAG TPA: GNAT family N-acetyltransferase [Candidatus Cybelea sp.]|nr:GNAT family N-acetyltransferase [Candidatus Cybelea sp.]
MMRAAADRFEIVAATSAPDIAAAKRLCLEYARSLDFSLCFQDFDAEMAAFPGEYAPPKGALLLAKRDGRPVGVVALREIESGVSEMKRLYLTPDCRKSGLGRALVQAIIAEARRLGYRAMRLDTVEHAMRPAIALYRALGFREIPPYTVNPQPDVLYMELAL